VRGQGSEYLTGLNGGFNISAKPVPDAQQDTFSASRPVPAANSVNISAGRPIFETIFDTDSSTLSAQEPVSDAAFDNVSAKLPVSNVSATGPVSDAARDSVSANVPVSGAACDSVSAKPVSFQDEEPEIPVCEELFGFLQRLQQKTGMGKFRLNSKEEMFEYQSKSEIPPPIEVATERHQIEVATVQHSESNESIQGNNDGSMKARSEMNPEEEED
jgi:hypothetical protein